MKDFNFKIPQNIQFGMGSLKKLPEILTESRSDKILLVSDRGLEKIGVVKKVQDIIETAGLQCTSYLDVVPNPTMAVVNEAADLYRKCGATSIVALGGGSSMDVGKAVGILANYGGRITDYEGNHKVPGPIVPMIAIPTTAGTGSEVTASAVITDTERNYKLSVFSYEILPRYAVLDPELIMTAPASIAASCGVDALIHAMEAYVSRNATPLLRRHGGKGHGAHRRQPAPLCGQPSGRGSRLRHDAGLQLCRHRLCMGPAGQCPRHEPPGQRVFQRAPRGGKLHPAAQRGGVQCTGGPWTL